MIYALGAIFVILVACSLVPGGLRWLALLTPHIIVKIGAWSLAYVAVKWFSTEDGRSLRWPLRWMMTKDADLEGDSYWRVECVSKGLDYRSFEAKVAWMRRNGAHSVNYDWLGVDVRQEWLDQYRSPVNGWITGGPLWATDDAFCLRLVVLGIEFYAGWNLLGPQNGRAKYWVQLRKAKPLNP